MSSRSDQAAQSVLAVRKGGGIVRSAQLIRAGASKHALAAAVADGLLLRLRRVWVAVPDADPELIAAARQGVTLSCITQARRLGLWVLREDLLHVAAHPHAGAVAVPRAHVHRAVPLVMRHPQVLEDCIENVLAIVAACQPFETALAIWESALNKQLVDKLALERLALSAAARAILEVASPFSGSGLESFIVPRLRWLRLRIIPQTWIAGHRVDFLIGERLVFQIDGGTHVGSQRTSDIRHDARLMLLGYHVIRVGYEQVIDDWPAVQEQIMRAVAQGLHRAA